MPLLDVIGVTSFNTTFFSAFVFLRNETEADYAWALARIAQLFDGIAKPKVIVTDRELALMRALNTSFPESRHLCVWHIEKNVLANCKRYFDTGNEWNAFFLLWTGVVSAENEQEFGAQWSELCTACTDKLASLVAYLRDVWIPYKERFVSACANRHLHLGNRTTSRAEGAHAALKRYLQKCRPVICVRCTRRFRWS